MVENVAIEEKKRKKKRLPVKEMITLISVRVHINYTGQKPARRKRVMKELCRSFGVNQSISTSLLLLLFFCQKKQHLLNN